LAAINTVMARSGLDMKLLTHAVNGL